MTIIYRRTFQGAWELSAIVRGRLFHRRYFDYTKREAAADFKAYVRTEVSR